MWRTGGVRWMGDWRFVWVLRGGGMVVVQGDQGGREGRCR